MIPYVCILYICVILLGFLEHNSLNAECIGICHAEGAVLTTACVSEFVCLSVSRSVCLPLSKMNQKSYGCIFMDFVNKVDNE